MLVASQLRHFNCLLLANVESLRAFPKTQWIDNCRCCCRQRNAKLDKPMEDGSTSLVKAFTARDMEMVHKLLRADVYNNFIDQEGKMHQFALAYQDKDRRMSGRLCLCASAYFTYVKTDVGLENNCWLFMNHCQIYRCWPLKPRG